MAKPWFAMLTVALKVPFAWRVAVYHLMFDWLEVDHTGTLTEASPEGVVALTTTSKVVPVLFRTETVGVKLLMLKVVPPWNVVIPLKVA